MCHFSVSWCYLCLSLMCLQSQDLSPTPSTKILHDPMVAWFFNLTSGRACHTSPHTLQCCNTAREMWHMVGPHAQEPPYTCMHLNDSLSLRPHLVVFSDLKITSPTPRGLTHTGIKTVVVRWITLQLHTCCSHGFRKGILQLFMVTESVTTKSILFLKHLGPDPTNTSLLTYWKWVMNITICSRRLLINCNFIWKINSRVYIQ